VQITDDGCEEYLYGLLITVVSAAGDWLFYFCKL